MEPFSIAALISMIASAGIQAHSANQAAKRQQAAATQAQARQMDARNETTRLAAQRAEEFDPSRRQTAQDAIQQQLAGQYEQAAQPQITAQGVQVGTTVPQGSGSTSYTVAKAKEEARTRESMHQLAGIMSRIGAPGLQRQNEAVGFGDTAGAIGRVQTGADNIAGIDQIGIQAAGQPDFLSNIAASALNAYGMSQAMGAGIPKAPPTGTPGGLGLRAPASWLG